MWLILPDIAVSVVAKDPTGAARLCVRARTRDDLDRLRRLYCPQLSPAQRNVGTDYEWRAYCPRQQWADTLASIGMGIDYPNMKAVVTDGRRHDVYMRIWSALHDLKPAPKPVVRRYADNWAGDPAPAPRSWSVDRWDER